MLKKQKRRRNRIALILLIAIICTVIIGLLSSKHCLKVSSYHISSEQIMKPVRIVHISDIHNSVFGDNNKRLIEKIEELEPDIILLTGDLLNMDNEDLHIAVELIAELNSVAAVYCSFGNHEVGYENNYEIDLKQIYENAGATVLDNEWMDLTINKNRIRLGGIYGYCLSDEYLKTGEAKKDEVDFLNHMAETSYYCILMAHMPVCWIKNGSLDSYNIDLVLSGHSHGGQIIIPFIGGLYAPDQGWFVGKDWGVFNSEDNKKHLILTTGLGNNEKIPRFNNIPEIVLIILEPVN